MPDGEGQQQQQQQQAPWYQSVPGIDQEVVGHWTNAGWINKKPEEIALEATRSWKAAERHLGAPANELVRLPKDPKDEAGWKGVWQRLGTPKDPKEYDFSAIKFADGTALDDAFVERVRAKAFALNLPKQAALEMAQDFTKYLDEAEGSEKLEKDAKLLDQTKALKTNWGPNYDANKFVAQRAAAALGIDPATVASLEGVIGYDKIMEMFRSIGEKIGEDKFVKSGAPGSQGGPMTREQAVAKKADLMSDPIWKQAYLNGDQAKLREMLALNTIISAVERAAA